MARVFGSPGRGLAGIAALLWVSSLVLPVVVLERGTVVRGWVVLVFGLFAFVGPWFANLAVAGALWSLLRGREARGWLAFVTLCAPTLLAVEGFGLAANSELTYGYGLGALAFALAIGTLWVAAGLSARVGPASLSTVESSTPARGASLLLANLSVILGTLVVVTVTTVAVVDGIRDRSAGNADEQAYLSFERAGLNVALSRRGPVCAVPPYSLQPAHGAPPESIELAQDTTGDSRLLEPFVPLAWGLRVLRLGDWDYEVVRLGDLPVVQVTARGKDPVAAVLSARHDSPGAGTDERLTVSLRRNDRSSDQSLTWRPVGKRALFAGRMASCPAITATRTLWAAAGSALGFRGATERHPDTGFATTIAAFQGPLTRADARVVGGPASAQTCPAGVRIDRGFWTPELRVATRNRKAPLGRPMRLRGRLLLMPTSPVIGNQLAALHCGLSAYYLMDWGRVDNLAFAGDVGLRVHALHPVTGALLWSRYVDVDAAVAAPVRGLVAAENGWTQLPAIIGVAEDADDLVVTLVRREPGAVPVSMAFRRPLPRID